MDSTAVNIFGYCPSCGGAYTQGVFHECPNWAPYQPSPMPMPWQNPYEKFESPSQMDRIEEELKEVRGLLEKILEEMKGTRG